MATSAHLLTTTFYHCWLLNCQKQKRDNQYIGDETIHFFFKFVASWFTFQWSYLAWHRTGEKPLPECVIVNFIDANPSHSFLWVYVIFLTWTCLLLDRPFITWQINVHWRPHQNTICVKMWVARSVDSTESACNGILDLCISEAVQRTSLLY